MVLETGHKYTITTYDHLASSPLAGRLRTCVHYGGATSGGLFGMDGNDDIDEDEEDNILWGLALLPHSLL